MNTQAKLRKLCSVYRPGKVCDAAGISSTALRNIINQPNCSPRVSTLKAIAIALGVDLAWLMDDKAEWPPVRIGTPKIDALPDDEVSAVA